MKTDFLWPSLEDRLGASVSLFSWKLALGESCSRFKRRWLLNKGRQSGHLECPSECRWREQCVRKVIPLENGKAELWCEENLEEPLYIRESDTFDYELNRPLFWGELNRLLELCGDPAEEGSLWDGIRLGVFSPEAGTEYPVYYLGLASKQDDNARALLLTKNERFVLITPTRNGMERETEQFLAQRGTLRLILGEEAFFDDEANLRLARTPQRIFAPLAGEAEKEKSATSGFPTPPGARWEDISIRFIDGHTVAINAGGVSGRYLYSEMGMGDNRSKNPDIKWRFFRQMMESRGVMDWDNTHANLKNKKRKSELNKKLCAFFHLEEEPIIWDRKEEVYRCRFEFAEEEF